MEAPARERGWAAWLAPDVRRLQSTPWNRTAGGAQLFPCHRLSSSGPVLSLAMCNDTYTSRVPTSLPAAQLFCPSTRRTRQASAPTRPATPGVRTLPAHPGQPSTRCPTLRPPTRDAHHANERLFLVPVHFALKIAVLVGLPPGGRSSCLRARPPLHRIGSDGPARGASATPMTGGIRGPW